MEYSLAIIPCTGQKNPDIEEGPAEEIWTGAHFQYTLAHVEMMYDRVLVLSYKYGLIEPSKVIETYDLDLRIAPPRAKIRWWFKVREDIIGLAKDPPLIVGLYTGSFFRDRIVREFVKNGIDQVITPWEGLGIGLRQAAVFDAEEPFDIDKARNHEYKVNLTSDGTPANKYLPPPTKLTDDIVWE